MASVEALRAMWWTVPEDEEINGAVTSAVRSIRQNQDRRKMADLLHASMYGPLNVNGFGWAANEARGPFRDRLSLNIARNMVNTVTSKIASKSRPKVTFLTEGGNYEQKTKAENLEKLIEGCFYESNFYAKMVRAFRFGAIFGTGFIKTYIDSTTRRVVYETVFPWEIVIDDGESLYGEPRTMYQRKYYDRAVLKAIFAGKDEELASKIDLCGNQREDAEFAFETVADQVLVTEAWHLPSKKGAKDGLHVITIDGADLLRRPWKRDTFPFSVMRWAEPVDGYFGSGLCEELEGLQFEINKLLAQIQRGQHLVTGHYLVQRGSQVTKAHINNDLTSILEYSGSPPVYQVPNIISPEIYAQLWRLKSEAYEVAGVSQMAASGTKPAGVDAAVAMRELNDIQSDRFLEVGQALEAFVLDVAAQTIACIKEVGGYKVKGVSKKSVEYIDFGDVNLDEDSYVMKMFPTSMLPSTPTGRLQFAEEMIQSGIISPEDVLDILGFPDTDELSKRRNAARNVVERNMSHMLKTGDVVTPEPYDNHPLAMRLCNETYHEWRLDGVPEDRLQLLRDYMAATDALMNPPAPMDPNLNAPPMPLGAPMAPPPGMMPPDMGAMPMDPNMMPPPDAGMPPDMGPPPM